MEENEIDKTDKRPEYPPYIVDQQDHIKHVWLQWYSISQKIDNHPSRFFPITNPNSGVVKVLDLKNSIGLAMKHAKFYGATPEDLAEVETAAREIQALKCKKSFLNKEWTKAAFGKKGERTILDLRYNEIVDLYSKFYSTDEIYDIIVNRWGMHVRKELIQKFYVDNKDKIELKRADYVLKSKDLRLATDAGRLEVLSNLAFEMEKKFEKSRNVDVSKEIRAIIEQIRREVKGDEIKLTIDGKIDINATIQANKSMNDALSKLPINMIVIGLTAAKQRINPTAIMASLANSYYARFNGFNRLADKSEIQLPGQYIKTMSWDDVKRQNHDNIVDIEPIEVFENSVPEASKPKLMTQRERLEQLLNSHLKVLNEE
jgi:hypothetical protein